jgi:hypothetical protein
MLDKQVFEEMLKFYSKSIPEMKHLGELDWCNAVNQTLKRLLFYFEDNLSEISFQLARECHADLQGYVQVKFGSNLMNADSCSSEDYDILYKLGQNLILIGGTP